MDNGFTVHVLPPMAHDLLEHNHRDVVLQDRRTHVAGRKDGTMTNAVSYAYSNTTEERPTLLDQFTACRDYAAAHSYMIVGEFNDIDDDDHKATGAALEAISDAVSHQGAATILVYQPSAAVLDRLNTLGATVENVTALVAQR
jgi:hypothetical protein